MTIRLFLTVKKEMVISILTASKSYLHGLLK